MIPPDLQLARQSLRPDAAALIMGVSKATLLRWEQRFPNFPTPSRPTDRVTLYDRDKLIAWRDSSVVKVPA